MYKNKSNSYTHIVSRLSIHANVVMLVVAPSETKRVKESIVFNVSNCLVFFCYPFDFVTFCKWLCGTVNFWKVLLDFVLLLLASTKILLQINSMWMWHFKCKNNVFFGICERVCVSDFFFLCKSLCVAFSHFKIRSQLVDAFFPAFSSAFGLSTAFDAFVAFVSLSLSLSGSFGFRWWFCITTKVCF